MKKIILLLFVLIFGVCFYGCENVPKPEIIKGEFPFEIVYQVNGETIIVNDVYVCEYAGIGWNEGVGNHRKWKGYIKSSGKEELVLLEDGDLKFAVGVGSPEYYMNDPDCSYSEYIPIIYYIKPNAVGGTDSGVLDIESLLEQYELKLISWKLSEPIQNSFK